MISKIGEPKYYITAVLFKKKEICKNGYFERGGGD